MVALGRGRRPWVFLQVAGAWLRVAPGDDLVRALAGANLARLGLRELALEQLSQMTAPARESEEGRQLWSVAAGLAESRLDPERLLRRCEAQARVLAARGVDLSVALAEWREGLEEREWFAAHDGNIVRRARGNTDIASWRGLEDAATQARTLVEAHFKSPGEWARPVAVEGVDPPFVFQGICGALQRNASGYVARVALLQADPLEFLDGLAMGDLKGELESERTVVFVGPDASERYGRWMRERMGVQLAGPVVVTAGTRTRLSPTVAEVVGHVEKQQSVLVRGLRERVEAQYRGRDARWWAERYREALSGEGPPLNVVIPTCRYSTYIQFASRDLAKAFERAGCRAEVLIEPDTSSRLSLAAYLEAFEGGAPDLVVLINYPRASLEGNPTPGNVPFVCWIQDAMGHLYSKNMGEAQGDLDFVVGHLHGDLFLKHGWDRARSLELPVTADEGTFHDGPVGERLPREMACEIACVTNHGESPREMHDRLRGQLASGGADANVVRLVDGLWERLPAIMCEAHVKEHHKALREAIVDISRRSLGLEPSETLVDQLHRQYALPVADRIFRHQALEWACSVAERRGWRLALYGRGWEGHPRFGRYARGVLEHGEALRAAYQCAAVNLHLSATTMVHQRVLECALSGGFTAARLFRDAVGSVGLRAQHASVRSGAPGEVREGVTWYSLAETSEGMAFAALCQRLGLTDKIRIGISPARRATLLARSDDAMLEQDPNWLLGDLAQTTFWDEASLESLAERAITRPSWRANLASGVKNRVRERLTTGIAVERILGLVSASLEASSDARPLESAA